MEVPNRQRYGTLPNALASLMTRLPSSNRYQGPVVSEIDRLMETLSGVSVGAGGSMEVEVTPSSSSKRKIEESESSTSDAGKKVLKTEK